MLKGPEMPITTRVSSRYLIEIIISGKETSDEITKIPGRSSKFCPRCFCESRKLVSRRRDYMIVGPLRREQCDRNISELRARVSSGAIFKNSTILRWLFSPPDPPTDYPWFETRAYATCKVHGRELVKELTGKRQFGRFRLWLFWIRARIIHTLDWVMSIR